MPKLSEVIHIRISPDVKRELENLARVEDRKVSTIAAILLKRALGVKQVV